MLNFLKQSIKAAGVALKAVWQAARTRLAILLAAARQKAAAFWQAHGQTVAWVAIWVAFGTLATTGLLYVYHTNPEARDWLDQVSRTTASILLAPLHWLLAAGSRSKDNSIPLTAQTVPPQPVPGLPQPVPGLGGTP